MTKKDKIIKEVEESLDLAELVSNHPKSVQLHIEEARQKLEKLKSKNHEHKTMD